MRRLRRLRRRQPRRRPFRARLYRSGFDDVDCGPGLDTIHATGDLVQVPTPIPLEQYWGQRCGVISNCELIVTDDTSATRSSSYAA